MMQLCSAPNAEFFGCFPGAVIPSGMPAFPAFGSVSDHGRVNGGSGKTSTNGHLGKRINSTPAGSGAIGFWHWDSGVDLIHGIILLFVPAIYWLFALDATTKVRGQINKYGVTFTQYGVTYLLIRGHLRGHLRGQILLFSGQSGQKPQTSRDTHGGPSLEGPQMSRLVVGQNRPMGRVTYRPHDHAVRHARKVA